MYKTKNKLNYEKIYSARVMGQGTDTATTQFIVEHCSNVLVDNTIFKIKLDN